MLAYDKTLKLSRSYPESTFVRIQSQPEIPQSFKQLQQMNQVLFFGLRLCNHIIDVYLNLLMTHIMKESHHCPLICYANIL